MAANNRSIRFLVLGTLALAFSLVLVFTITQGVKNERQRAEHFAHKQAESLGKSYFDALNTMMLTGAMANRQVLQGKLQGADDVLSVRAIRSDSVIQAFGPGLAGEQTADEWDRRALAGETIEVIRDGQAGRVMTVIKPVRAEKDYQGTNCLMCHQVPEQSVLGAMRVDYSLARMDDDLVKTMMTSAGVQIILFIVAFFVTAWVLNRVVVQRLHRFNESMSVIANNSDFTIELEVLRDDEIGSVSRDFNRMIGQINSSMHQVVGNAGRLLDAAKQITVIAETTGEEVLQQKQNTDQVVAAMTEMAASSEQVRGNAVRTAEHSNMTNQSAEQGREKAQVAASEIQNLNGAVQQGAERIRQLNSRTDEVAAVLEVISSIAEQTNLLALNAAIEAARAGEQGRGFAVVADEVRSLASRTQDSTNDIRQTIERLSADAADCVQVMEQASQLAEAQVVGIQTVAEDLQSIASAVEDINGLNAQMEVAANEQSQVAESINQNVMGISQSAETTSSHAQSTASIAKDMLLIANELEETVGQFKLKHE